MPLRFPLSPPRDVPELFERIRELLPQLEPKIVRNVQVNVEETAIAHGMKTVPQVVRAWAPHCLAMVCESRQADAKHIYLRASNVCVCNVEIVA